MSEQNLLQQAEHLKQIFRQPLQSLAASCGSCWHEPKKLNSALKQVFDELGTCESLYAVDVKGHRISNLMAFEASAATALSLHPQERAFLNKMTSLDGVVLSESYLSEREGRMILTSLRAVADADGKLVGYVAADFDLRKLAQPGQLQQGGQSWRQFKGDPAIRQTVFLQERIRSPLDEHLDEFTDAIVGLMAERGVFHVQVHYSSSRATMWMYDDPHRYRIHSLEEVLEIHRRFKKNPAHCLAYPQAPYYPDAMIPAEKVREVHTLFRILREADETVYLRSGSINLINGMVGLTFSCDGSHYLLVDEFLRRGSAFWFGGEVDLGPAGEVRL